MNQQEQTINDTFKQMLRAGVPEQEASDWYKSKHQALIEQRKAEEAVARRTEEAEIRYCIQCGAALPPPTGRGRPPTKCESCRGNDMA